MVRLESSKLSVFPAFFRVADQQVAVFGEGDEAFAKVRLLANTQARIVAFAADTPEADYATFLAENHITVHHAAFDARQLDGMTLVFAATGDRVRDRAIVAAARQSRIPANAVDQPDQCDFFTPALVNRAPVAVAIGTEGAGPVLAQMIRAEVDRLLPQSLGPLARLAASYRTAVDRLLPRGVARRLFWRDFFKGAVADAVALGDVSGARRRATRLLKASAEPQPLGRVDLVGAGPGAGDLLTLRAHRLLMEADVILFDALVSDEVIDMARRDALRISVGKRKGCHSKSQDEINTLMVELAREGKRIVRLKAGDPLVFGRAGEEMAALRDAGIPYEVIPGVTAALAAAADFELPLTLRGVASSLVFTTGHDLKGESLPDWARLALSGATVAVYMGRSVAASVAGRLMEAGLAEDTTVALVENAGRRERRLAHGMLKELPLIERLDDLKGPVMVIIGDAVAGANFENSAAIRSLVEAVPQDARMEHHG